MDQTAKEQVKDDLVAHLRSHLLVTDPSVEALRAAVPATGDLGRLDAQQRLDLKEAEALDMSTRDTVGPGAIIELDGHAYVVGVATDSFTSGGVSYLGMAVDAPIYDAIRGLRASSTFDFGGHRQQIDSVA